MDYYSILGINKQASQDEIKKAYRKQAMANHPDRGGDSGKFAQINEAYETLKDPNKRQAYDNPQVRMNTQSFDANDMNTIFEAMFGRGARPQQRRNQDIKIGIRISLADAATGKDVLATYKLRNGRESSASIRIHPGVNDMEVIRFQGLGDATHPQLPRGDLLVQIRVLSHARFERDGRNLRTNLDVDVFELMLGTTMIIDKLTGGPLRVKIPKGTNPGTVLSVAGHGMPDPKAGRTGNLYIHIKGILPKLNTIQEEKVKRLNDELNNGS